MFRQCVAMAVKLLRESDIVPQPLPPVRGYGKFMMSSGLETSNSERGGVLGRACGRTSPDRLVAQHVGFVLLACAIAGIPLGG